MTQSAPYRLILVLFTVVTAPAALAASHEGLRYYSLGVRAPMSSPLTTQPGVAVKLSVLPPTVGSGAPGAELAATFSPRSDRSDPVMVHLNAAAGLTAEQRVTSFAGAVLEGPGLGVARPVYEMFIERDTNGATEFSVLIGGLYRVRESLTIDAGLRVSRGNELSVYISSTSEVRCGLTWLF